MGKGIELGKIEKLLPTGNVKGQNEERRKKELQGE
jgi:hypothetical protein